MEPDQESPALLIYKVARLEEEQRRLKTDIAALREERRKDEERRLKAGIAALGSATLALGGVVWWLLPSNVQHMWDIIRNGDPR